MQEVSKYPYKTFLRIYWVRLQYASTSLYHRPKPGSNSVFSRLKEASVMRDLIQPRARLKSIRLGILVFWRSWLPPANPATFFAAPNQEELAMKVESSAEFNSKCVQQNIRLSGLHPWCIGKVQSPTRINHYPPYLFSEAVPPVSCNVIYSLKAKNRIAIVRLGRRVRFRVGFLEGGGTKKTCGMVILFKAAAAATSLSQDWHLLIVWIHQAYKQQ